MTDMDEAEVSTTIIHLSLPACHQWTEVRERMLLLKVLQMRAVAVMTEEAEGDPGVHEG